MKLQCLFYALDMWQETGGYILFRKSTHWNMPHVLHMDNKTGKITHYVPPDDLKYPWYSMFGFEGYIKTWDDEDCPPPGMWCMFFGTAALVVCGAVWYVNRLVTRKNNRRSSRREANRHGFDRRKT